MIFPLGVKKENQMIPVTKTGETRNNSILIFTLGMIVRANVDELQGSSGILVGETGTK